MICLICWHGGDVDMLTAALEYHAQGLAVFPLPYGEKWDERRWAWVRG
jgi:hypothetical protein